MTYNIEEQINSTIDSIPAGDYGANYQNHLLEQYKIYISLADKISDRRASTNTFFLTLNTTIVTAIGIAGYYEKDKFDVNRDYIILLTTGLLFFCYIWFRLIRSYKDLNSAKFRVIHSIENKLPIRPFDAEWAGLARGKNSRIYLPFSKIEIFIPLIWACLYIVITAYLFILK